MVVVVVVAVMVRAFRVRACDQGRASLIGGGLVKGQGQYRLRLRLRCRLGLGLGLGLGREGGSHLRSGAPT